MANQVVVSYLSLDLPLVKTIKQNESNHPFSVPSPVQLCIATCNEDDKNQQRCCSSDPVVSYLLPHVITPNGDGVNDKFCIAGLNNLWAKSLILKNHLI